MITEDRKKVLINHLNQVLTLHGINELILAGEKVLAGILVDCLENMYKSIEAEKLISGDDSIRIVGGKYEIEMENVE